MFIDNIITAFIILSVFVGIFLFVYWLSGALLNSYCKLMFGDEYDEKDDL